MRWLAQSVREAAKDEAESARKAASDTADQTQELLAKITGPKILQALLILIELRSLVNMAK